MIQDGDKISNIINIYDDKIHPNWYCNQIKMDWLNNCDLLSRNKKNENHVKSYEECHMLFENYYTPLNILNGTKFCFYNIIII